MNSKVGVFIMLWACASYADASIANAVAKFFAKFGDEVPLHHLDQMVDDIPINKVAGTVDELPVHPIVWAIDEVPIYKFDDVTLMSKYPSVKIKGIVDEKLHRTIEHFIGSGRKLSHRQMGIPYSSQYIVTEKKYQRNFIIDYAVKWGDGHYENFAQLNQTECGRAAARRIFSDALQDVKEKYAVYRKIIVKPKMDEIFHLSFRHLYIQAFNEHMIPALGIKKISLKFKDKGYLFQDVKLSVYSLCGFKISYSARTGKVSVDGGVVKGKKSFLLK